MPKLFVPVSYVDEQMGLLKEEIANLKNEIAQLRGGAVAVTVVDKSPVDSMKNNMKEGEIDPAGSTSAGMMAFSPEEPQSPLSNTSPDKQKLDQQMSKVSQLTQDISALGSVEKIAMVCFDRKSAWSIPLVTTLDGASDFFDAFLAMLLLLANVLMQALFIGIIQLDAFLGEDYSNQVDTAKTWRKSFAHDAKYLDLTDRSLASRVCNEDGSLIFSNGQVEVLSQINAFLGMEKDEFTLPWLQPGVLLSVLCILLWDLCIFKEYRSIWHAVQGLFHVPKGEKTTFGEGVLQSMSQARVALLSAVCLVRVVVATMLMINGSIWLSRTTSISELMLNAVALEAVIHVDEFLFSGLTPTKIQYRIQNLPPVKIRQSKRSNLLENFVFTALLIGALVVPFTLWLSPLSETMTDVKFEMCGGNRTFIVAFNPDTQQTVGRVTRPIGTIYDINATAPPVEVAVAEHIFSDPVIFGNASLGENEKYIDFTRSEDGFQKWASQSMDDYGSLYPICLEQFLGEGSSKVAEFGKGSLARSWELHFRSAALVLGRPNATKCSDLSDLCELSQARLLRFACGLTCGCHLLNVNPFYRTRSQGCNQGCIQIVWGHDVIHALKDRKIDFESPCTDIDNTHPAFAQWVDSYIDALAEYSNIEFDDFKVVDTKAYRDLYLGYVVKSRGCSELRAYDLFSNTEWCRGHPGLYRPMAWICPETCGCKSSDDPERNSWCFGKDYCPFTIPENKTPYEADAYLRRIDRYRLFLHAPQIQWGGQKLP